MFYVLLLLAALGVTAIGWLLRRRAPALGQGVMIAGIAGVIACLVWQVRQTIFQPQAEGPDRGEAVVAYFLANQVAREVGNAEGSVLLLFPPESVMDQESVGTYTGTFKRVLRAFPRLGIKTATLQVAEKEALKGQIPLNVFQEAIRSSSTAVAYVSFAGVPAGADQLFDSTEKRPVVVFDPWSTTAWVAPLKSRSLRAVIVPRPGVSRTARENVSGEPGAVFEQLYLLATPSNADEVASQLN